MHGDVGPGTRSPTPAPPGHLHVVLAGLGHSRVDLARATVTAGHRTTVHDPRPELLGRLLTELSPHDATAATLRLAIGAGQCLISADSRACAGFDVALVCPAPRTPTGLDDPVEEAAVLLAPYVRGHVLVVLVVRQAATATVELFEATVELLSGRRAGRDYRLGLMFTGPAGPPTVVTSADPAAARQVAVFLHRLGRRATPVLPASAAECVAALQRVLPRHADEVRRNVVGA